MLDGRLRPRVPVSEKFSARKLRGWFLSERGDLSVRAHIARTVAIAALVFGLLAAADIAYPKLTSGSRWGSGTTRVFLWSGGLGIIAGALGGLLLGGAQALVARLRGWWIILFWLLLGGLLGAWLVDDLGVLVRLGSRDDLQAKAALGASVGAGLGLFVLGLVGQPHRGRPQGWLAKLRPLLRVPLTLGLVGVAAAMVWVDRNFEVSQYDNAHLTMRWMAAASLAVALLAQPRLPRRPKLALLPWLAGLLLAAVPMAMITPDQKRELESMLRRPYPEVAIRVIRRLGDPDGDDYSSVLGGTDCDPFNPDVHPGAEEIPGNGIDDNCLLGDAPRHDVDTEEIPVPTEPAPTSVVLITVDTVTALHTSLYGHKNENTPNLTEWAEDAAVFERAYTSGGWTSLALSSMFRGLYPRRLRWTRVFEAKNFDLLRRPIPEDVKVRLMFGLPIEDPRPPLAWYLQRRGMYTVAVVNDAFTEFLDARYGTDTGFEEFIDLDDLDVKRVNDDHVSDAAIEALGEVPEGRPFFMWVHYFGPHTPSTAHKGTKSFGKSHPGRYDHEIAFFDKEVKRLLDSIEEKDPSIAVIIASDHGEVVSKRGRTHGVDLREQAIRIPLLLKAPEVEPGRYSQIAGLVDVMPTILALTATPGPTNLDGMNLAELITSPDGLSRIMISENWRFNREGEFNRNLVAVYDGKLKLTRDLQSEATSLRKQRDENLKENLHGKKKADKLERALDLYLEENNAVDLHD